MKALETGAKARAEGRVSELRGRCRAAEAHRGVAVDGWGVEGARLRRNRSWVAVVGDDGCASGRAEGAAQADEIGLKGPALGERDADAARRSPHARRALEDPVAQSLDLDRAQAGWQAQAKEIGEVVGGGMQQQSKLVGDEAMAAQPVGGEAVFQLFDAVLALAANGGCAAVVVEAEAGLRAGGRAGHQEAKVGARRCVLHFVADPPPPGPAPGPVAQRRDQALRRPRPAAAPPPAPGPG